MPTYYITGQINNQAKFSFEPRFLNELIFCEFRHKPVGAVSAAAAVGDKRLSPATIAPVWAPEHTSKCHKFIWILIYFDEHITGGHTGPPLQIYVLFIICSLIQKPCPLSFPIFSAAIKSGISKLGCCQPSEIIGICNSLEKEKVHRPIIPIMIKNSKIKYPKFR